MIARKNIFALAFAALFALMLWSDGASAAGQFLCAQTNTSRRVVNTSSTTSPQPSYQLNAHGCAFIAQADVGFFLTQGYTPGPNNGTIIFTTGVATSTTDFVIGNLPPNAYIQMVVYDNSTANAVTGGITLGSTANATDIATATVCGANCLAQATDAQLVKRAWSKTAATPIHAAAATAWNSANVTITVTYGFF